MISFSNQRSFINGCMAVFVIQSFIIILISLTGFVYLHSAWTKIIEPKSFPRISRLFTPTNISVWRLVDAVILEMYYSTDSTTIYFVCAFEFLFVVLHDKEIKVVKVKLSNLPY